MGMQHNIKPNTHKPYKSVAKWPPGICGGDGNMSTDLHFTYEEAGVVCQLLKRHGFGGEGKIFPLSTWVVASGGEPG